MTLFCKTRMNPGGRFAPQSQLSETAKDGALLRGFWGATLDLGRGSGGGGGLPLPFCSLC